VVAEGIAGPEVDAVGLLGRLRGDLDAPGTQLVAGGPGVVRGEEETAAVLPLVSSSRTCSVVAASMTGGPGFSRRICRLSPGTPRVRKRMNPISTSFLISSPGLPPKKSRAWSRSRT